MADLIEKQSSTVETAIPQSLSEKKMETKTHWSEEQEKKLVRKIDRIVMPLLMLGFFALQLDRANIGNTLTDGFLKDIGVSQNDFNVGQQLLSTGIVLLEIPGNIIMYRLGPKIWISGQIVAWGFVATFQAFQHGIAPYMVTRLLLGLCESGFIPGGLFTLSLWYKGPELSKRFAFFFFGNGLAQAVGGLVAYGVLRMRGIAGLAGWQWLFILEGIFTILAGVSFAVFFPGTPHDPVTLTGIKYFSDEEVDILRRRIIEDDPSKANQKKIIDLADVRKALSNWRLYPHVILTIVGLAPTTALWSYMPTIIAGFGYNRLNANALTSVGQWISICLVILAGYLADISGHRGFIVLQGICWQWVFSLAYKCLPNDASAGTKYALLTLAAATCSWWHAVNGSWLSMNARSPSERSVAMAMFGMAANCAGIVGGQLFRSDDLPFYHRGWTIIVCFLSLGVALVLFAIVQYFLTNRYKGGATIETGKREEDSEVWILRKYNF